MENVIIDPSWVEIQTGLYLESYERINFITGLPMIVRILHSGDGYCFYDSSTEYYDEEGNPIPNDEVSSEMRMYYQYMAIPESKDINDFVSVPIEPGYEIANTSNNTVTQ